MTQAKTCFLCGCSGLYRMDYLNLGSLGPVRWLAYRLPHLAAKAAAKVSPRFGRAYRPVEVNRRYFDRTICYCEQCGTGGVEPRFEEARLSQYYEEYYWGNRDEAEGKHVAADDRPNELQLAWSAERIAWIEQHTQNYSSAIDFGAGDCAASYLLREKAKVVAVDPSTKARERAEQYGVGWAATLAECEPTDLLFASHSLEHVHDLLGVFQQMLDKVRPQGHLFFEVPNISSKEVLVKLCHTPHTWMLSKTSFAQLADHFGCRIVAMEDVRGPWRIAGKRIDDPSNADLRVLIQRS